MWMTRTTPLAEAGTLPFWRRPVTLLFVMAAAMPVAGNVYMLAQHYGVAPQRASSAILIATAAAVLTLSFVIARVLLFTG